MFASYLVLKYHGNVVGYVVVSSAILETSKNMFERRCSCSRKLLEHVRENFSNMKKGPSNMDRMVVWPYNLKATVHILSNMCTNFLFLNILLHLCYNYIVFLTY